MQGAESKAKARVLLATVPADDSEPRAVASVPVATTELKLLAWRTRSGRLCLAGMRVDEQSTGLFPIGPCLIAEPCRLVCVEQEHTELAGDRTLVAGVVAASADELLLRRANGEEIGFELNGPLIPGFPEWRAFGADLGRRSFGVVEVYRDGRRIDRRETPEYDYETQDCIERALREQRDESPCF